MKKLILFIFSILVLAGLYACGKGSGFELKKSVDHYQVTVNLSKSPAIVGHNHITVKVEDKAGKIVSDAEVLVEYSMPEMPGMPAMNYETSAGFSGIVYEAHMNISMAGPWNIAVKIHKGDHVSTVRLSIDAR